MVSTKEFEHAIAKSVTEKYTCRVILQEIIPYALFCAKDITASLGQSRAVSHGHRLDDTQKQYITIDTNGGKQKQLFITYSGLAHIIRLSRSPIAIDFAKVIGLDVITKHYASIESDTIKCIMETFKHHTMKRQYAVDRYLIDLYFVDAKLAIECDERPHLKKAHQMDDEIRQAYIESKLGCTFIRYSPQRSDFSIFSVLNEISNKLSGYTEQIRQRTLLQEQIRAHDSNMVGTLWNSYCICIFRTDITSESTQYIIEFCDALRESYESIRTKYPLCRLEYITKYNGDIRMKYIIEGMLEPLKSQDVYDMSLTESICIVEHIKSICDLLNDPCHSSITTKMSKICEYTELIINDEPIQKNTCDTFTQTDMLGEELASVPQSPWKDRFDQFIDTHCILHDHAEVNAKDIVGLQRLVAREAKQEITAAFTDYLKRRFKYERLRVQHTDKVVMGYHGVALKPITYQRTNPTSTLETFVFDKCVFRPGGTALIREMAAEYKEWKRHMELPSTDSDESELKTYLKQCPYVLFETVWTQQGNGQGFYGIALKRDERTSRISSTASKIEKRDSGGNVLSKYVSIVKAAEEEGMSAAKMSRCVKNRVMFQTPGGDYYYTKI